MLEFTNSCNRFTHTAPMSAGNGRENLGAVDINGRKNEEG